MVTGYKLRRRLLLSRVTLRGSGQRVGASVCRMQPQTLRLALDLAGWAGPRAPPTRLICEGSRGFGQRDRVGAGETHGD